MVGERFLDPWVKEEGFSLPQLDLLTLGFKAGLEPQKEGREVSILMELTLTLALHIPAVMHTSSSYSFNFVTPSPL